MRTTIGTFKAVDRTVPVTFSDGEFVYRRNVNAVVDGDGNYDKAATRARVMDVALGVAAKRERGVFTTAAPEPE
jgi:hypothetical protein